LEEEFVEGKFFTSSGFAFILKTEQLLGKKFPFLSERTIMSVLAAEGSKRVFLSVSY